VRLDGGIVKQKRAGLLLIAIGVILPLLLLLLTTGYNPDASTISNIFSLRIPVYGSLVVPYRFPLALCIFLIFLGIRSLEHSRGTAAKDDDPTDS
jgi:hypothetical protein